MAKKLLLAGYFGFDNSGDDAILKAMVDNLKKLNKDLDLTALSKDPEKTAKTYNIKAANRFSYKEVRREMKNTDVFVFGGGSLLQDITSSRSLYYYLFLLKMAYTFKKPVFIFANGIGPINKAFNRRLTKKVLDKAAYITLRDQSSYNFVRALGVKNDHIEVTADPVFLLESSSDARVDQILEDQNIVLSDRVLGISLRQWQKSPMLSREVAKFCDSLVEEDLDILVLPMHYPYDVEYCQQIKTLSKNKRVHVIDSKYEVEDLIGLLKRCQLVMAMRLHALIYAAKANVPVIGLVYDPKLAGLINDLSIREYIKVEDLTKERLREKYDLAMEDLEDRAQSMFIANKRQEDLAQRTIEILEETLL
ncbi:MAG: polysaccharide pyruvyl transferase CsaB [Bacillota bacterium]|nr:polysaccharide pyruvyl transferase CsaB [Bacillota bacterium]